MIFHLIQQSRSFRSYFLKIFQKEKNLFFFLSLEEILIGFDIAGNSLDGKAKFRQKGSSQAAWSIQIVIQYSLNRNRKLVLRVKSYTQRCLSLRS